MTEMSLYIHAVYSEYYAKHTHTHTPVGQY